MTNSHYFGKVLVVQDYKIMTTSHYFCVFLLTLLFDGIIIILLNDQQSYLKGAILWLNSENGLQSIVFSF